MTQRAEREDVTVLCLCSEKCSNKKREDPFLYVLFHLKYLSVVIFGLFSDIERLVVLPTCHIKYKIYVLLSCTLKTELHKLNHSPLSQPPNPISYLQYSAASFSQRQQNRQLPLFLEGSPCAELHRGLMYILFCQYFLSDFPISLRAP